MHEWGEGWAAEAVAWLERRATLTDEDCSAMARAAAARAQVAPLEWLHRRGRLTMRAGLAAKLGRWGNVGMLRWFAERELLPRGVRGWIIQGALALGHIAVLDWLEPIAPWECRQAERIDWQDEGAREENRELARRWLEEKWGPAEGARPN